MKRSVTKKGLHSDTMHNIGTLYHNRGENDLALKQYQESIKIKEQINDTVGMASSYGQMGQLYLEKEDYSVALIHFIKAFLIFLKTDSPEVRKAVNGILQVREKIPEAEFSAILKEYGFVLVLRSRLLCRVASDFNIHVPQFWI